MIKKAFVWLLLSVALPGFAGYETGGARNVDMRWMALEHVKDNTSSISPAKTLPTGNPIGCSSGSTMDNATWDRYPIIAQQSFSMDDFLTIETANSDTVLGRWMPPEGGQNNDHSNQGVVHCGYLASTGVGETPTGDRTGDVPSCFAGWFLYGGTDGRGTTINEEVNATETDITVDTGANVRDLSPADSPYYAMIRNTGGVPDFTHVEWVKVQSKAGNVITVTRSDGSCSGCNHLRSTNADTNNTALTFTTGDFFLEVAQALGGSKENLHFNSGATAVEDGAGRRWNEFIPYYLITRGNQTRDQNGVDYAINIDIHTWDVDLQMRGSKGHGDYNNDLVTDEGVVVSGASPQIANMTRSIGYHDMYENYRALCPNCWLVSGQLLAYDWYWDDTGGADQAPNVLNGTNTEGVPRGETGQHAPNPNYELFDGEFQAANMWSKIGVRPRLNMHIEKGPDSTNPTNKDGYVRKFIPVTNTKAGLIDANITGSLTPGDNLTFQTSGATAVLDKTEVINALQSTYTLSISEVSGNPQNGENILVSAVNEANTIDTFTNYLSQGNRVPRFEIATILMAQAKGTNEGDGAVCYDKRGWNHNEDSEWGKTQHHDFMAIKSNRNSSDPALTTYALGEAVDRTDNAGVRAGYGWLGNALMEPQSVVVFDNPNLWDSPDTTYTFATTEGWTSTGGALSVTSDGSSLVIDRVGNYGFSQAAYGAESPLLSYTANQENTIMIRMKVASGRMRPIRVALDNEHNIFLVHDEFRWYRATLKADSTGTHKLFIYTGKWDLGYNVEVDEIRIYKNVDTRVWWQQYEEGILLLNATGSSYTVNTFALTGNLYKEFTRSDTPTGGVSTMDPDGIHDGSIQRIVTIPSEDGRILWKP